ncbi:MAG: FAD-dependent oxidoreductase [Deltaproteobacteria bacterium]|nr:FAD-dependent oxidoreductase [Deltaproteobacteria bacterium]
MQRHRSALADTRAACFWLDQPTRPPARPALSGSDEAELAIVGGGFTGLWTALQAKERDPGRQIVLVEASRVAEGASGRNGGFADPSLTHGVFNGMRHFPSQFEELEKLGMENYAGFIADIERLGIDAGVEENGSLSVATRAHEVEGLQEYRSILEDLGESVTYFDEKAVRAELNSPTYLAGAWHHSGGVVDPARLAWGLLDAIVRLGVRVYEQTPVSKLERSGVDLVLHTPSGRIRAKKAIFATNAFRSPVRRMRAATIPVWDYALTSEPLSPAQRAAIGWARRQGVGDSGNQFHYYRLTVDDRILWGGYDAIYHFGGRTDPAMQQRAASFEGLSLRFFDTFPQLEGLRFSHGWGGPIATTTRFCMDAGTAHRGRVSWAIGYTGLGLVASRFGGRVALDLLDDPKAPHLALGLVRKRPFPWPPEPLRSIGIGLTQRGLARADQNQGRRGIWLRIIDRAGLGFDS